MNFITALCLILILVSCNHTGKEETNIDSVVNESNITPPADLGSQQPANGATPKSDSIPQKDSSATPAH